MADSTLYPDKAVFQVRRHQARRRRLRHGVVIGLVAAIALALSWIVFFSPVLAVRQVAVEGVSLISADAVIAAAAVPEGTPLIRVSQSAVAQRVTSALPEVEKVEVSRRWPGTLVIHVTERTIVFQVVDAGGFGWVSADGTVFHISPDAQPVPTATVGIEGPKMLSEIATVVAALPDSLSPFVASIIAPTADSITLQLSDGRQIMWGSAEQSDLKAQVIVPLLTVPGQVYDVSAPSNPAVR